jgi:hypothetical protein
LFDHLYGKTKSKKLRPTSVRTVKEDQLVIAWVLSMQEIGLSINQQKFKMKVVELT